MIVFSQNRASLSQMLEENPDFLKKLPESEQKLYDLYVIKKINQRDIAKLKGVTQGAVSSRLKRILWRLQFMKYLSGFDISKFDLELSPLFNAFEIELLRSMMETTCQTETAERLNALFNLNKKYEGAFVNSSSVRDNVMNQVKVRHRFEKCLQKMALYKHPYFDMFMGIRQNLYMLHEVKLPHFDRSTK